MLNKLQALRNKMKKKGKGFTLVELIVVIIIIAIIAAVAIPRIVAFQESARKSRINSEHRQLVTAIQSYIGQNPDKNVVTEVATIEALKPFMNVNKTEANATLTEELAKKKDGTSVAHEITNGVLVSTFDSKDEDRVPSKTWRYSF